MAFWMSQLLLLITMTTMVYSYIYKGKTSRGDWGSMEHCNPGTIVIGFRLRVEWDQGYWKDDVAMTAIQFRCTDGKILTSNQLGRGSWKAWHYCSNYGTVSGINFRSEHARGIAKDDSAANNMNLHCIDETGKTSWISGDGMYWGDWDAGYCPAGQRICSLQTKVEDSGSVDQTGLNQIGFNCCGLPQL